MGAVDNRRAFLRNALPSAFRAPAPAADLRDGRPWASPAACVCSDDRLAALIDDHGLDHRRDAVLALARRGVRFVPDATRRVGPADPATASAEDLRAALDLRELDHGGPAALGGLLMVRVAFEAGARVGRATGRIDRTAPSVTSSIGGVAVAGSAEVVLPRAWAAGVEALGLTTAEQDRWTALRDDLAADQGVVPRDATDGSHRLHRLLGYPDERTGLLPLRCEHAARGGAPEDLPLPPPAALEQRARRWILLLQLEPPGDPCTVTVWVDRDRLARGDLRRLVALRPRAG